MIDGRGRTIDYLRISITDRCNLRCCYCMPEDGVELMDHGDILSYGEIERICKAGILLGINKVKITGGEPLVRKDVAALINRLTGLEGMKDVTMTSNGCLLGEMAESLAAAGLSSVNVSLDTLNPEKYARITRRDLFSQVMDGIYRAVACGLQVKLNCAVMEDLKELEVIEFSEFSRKNHIPVRFIEMMPIGQGRQYQALNNDDFIRILSKRYEDFKATDQVRGNGPAAYYTYEKGEGCVGFISAVHHKFCGQCNRVRLTSDGYLKLCLDSEAGVDLRTPLRNGIAEKELAELLEKWVMAKPESHHFEQEKTTGLNMNQIGG